MRDDDFLVDEHKLSGCDKCLKGIFYDSIFDTVKCNDSTSASGREKRWKIAYKLVDIVKFVIDGDPDTLEEGSSFILMETDIFENIQESASRAEAFIGFMITYTGRYRRRSMIAHITVSGESSDHISYRSLFDDLVGSLTRRRIKSHIERSIALEAKSASFVRDMLSIDPEIE